ncbi:MAG: hypothetical protein LBR80_08655 [Deltaproteobacteria bacterium]|jgi:virulence-associated protein VagC|nr:hypothetical protein [Deltaproteobacteria bacterium]
MTEKKDNEKKDEGIDSIIARVVETGEGQIIKLPPDCRVEAQELVIFHDGPDLVLRTIKENNIAGFFDKIKL